MGSMEEAEVNCGKMSLRIPDFNGGVCWEGDIVRLCLSIYILFFFFFNKDLLRQ